MSEEVIPKETLEVTPEKTLEVTPEIIPKETPKETLEEIPEEIPEEHFEVFYSCLRCATKVSNAELNKLPEIKCICGFRVFTKVRPPVVKTIKAV